MTTRAVERVEEWPSEPFPGGYAALHDLADREFSGIVQVGLARLCMTGGTVVGVLDGDIEDFEDDGTAYEAPTPALPLLALMQERNDEVKAKYYSEDTPISEVDETLSNGKFSGFIELSENVLSGDYYLVYHAGRSMAVAFVGNTKQLLTDDEAFDRADGEVGIYQVRPADVEPVDIPEAEDDEPEATTDEGGESAATGAGTGTVAAADETTEETDSSDDADESATATTADADTTAEDAPTAASGVTPDDEADATGTASDADASSTSEETADSRSETAETATQDSDDHADSATTAASADAGTGAAGTPEDADSATPSESATETGSDADAGRHGHRDALSDEGGSQSDESVEHTTQQDTRRETAEQSSESRRRSERSSHETRSTRSSRDGSTAESSSAGRQARETDQSGGPSSEPDRDRSETRPGSQPGPASGSAPAGGRTPADSTAEPSDGDSAESGRTSGAGSAGSVGPDQLERRSLPSLDPARSSSSRDDGSVAGTAGSAGPTQPTSQDPPSETGRPTEHEPEPQVGRTRRDQRTATDSGDASHASSESRTERDATRSDAQSRDSSRTAESSAADGAGATPRDRADGDRHPDAAGANSTTGDVPHGDTERVAELESEIDDLETELETVETELEEVEAERADLREDRNALREERDRLREERDELREKRDALERERDELQADVDDLEDEVENLESQLEQLESQYGAKTDAETRLTPQEALDQTNLFIRYESKGRATLETAHDGNASRDEVNENLGLEYHTQFDAATASVGGEAFDAFLTDTIEYRFVSWVIHHLLYEIRDTGKIAAMKDLYDAIPRIDRAELNGEITAEFTEDGQERRTQESFDVVLRDRMGNALIVANLNDSRQAATESMLSSLVTASSRVGEGTETLAASFQVTSSFFEPEALETTSEATSGGLLSRDKRQSFVKLTRKQGYHLCLVEAREGKFHLAVPEL